MERRDEVVLAQDIVDHYSYKNIMQLPMPKEKVFQHDDGSANKVLVFASGGYISLSVVPNEQKKASGTDRKLLFQHRSKATMPAQQWTQVHKPKEAGWKFHISIAQNPVNLEKAWDALVPILLKYKIGQTKIVHQDNQQDASKVITVYTFSGGPNLDQWEPFVRDVESAFKENEIRPGEKIFEYEIKGSQYFYYRNDADHNGDYVRDEYNFLYKVVSQIPVPKEQELLFSEKLTENPKNVGYIVKLKESDECCLYVKNGDEWDRERFDISLLNNIEAPNQDQQLVLAPIKNRQAYLEVVAPRLDQTLPSTNNVTNEPLPFKDIDLTKELAHHFDEGSVRSFK